MNVQKAIADMNFIETDLSWRVIFSGRFLDSETPNWADRTFQIGQVDGCVSYFLTPLQQMSYFRSQRNSLAGGILVGNAIFIDVFNLTFFAPMISH